MQRTEDAAAQQSLLSEDELWAMNRDGHLYIFREEDAHLNRREDSYQKMAEREMVGQIGQNPFSQRDYLQDITVQDHFLKPISTSVEKEKHKE